MKPLKIISLKQDTEVLLKRAARGDREAQNRLYHRYAPVMLGVCRRYISDVHYAEDVLVKGFLKVFTRLDSYRGEGSFEGWIRRIMVRECIDHLRRDRPEFCCDATTGSSVFDTAGYSLNTSMEYRELQELIDRMPDGYRTVFMLFAVEGYSHREIAEMLGISVSTSKSQVFKARRMLQQQLAVLKSEIYATRTI